MSEQHTVVRPRAVHVASVADWPEAIRVSAALLVDLGVATDEYVTACVDSVHARGPYIVLAPGLALAHARPEQGSTGVGVSLARLGEPVTFGHPTNDPVDLVFAFATADADAHLRMLRALATALAGGLAAELRDAPTSERLGELLTAAVAHV